MIFFVCFHRLGLVNRRTIYKTRINRDLGWRIIVRISRDGLLELLDSSFSYPKHINYTNSGLKGRKVSSQIWGISDHPEIVVFFKRKKQYVVICNNINLMLVHVSKGVKKQDFNECITDSERNTVCFLSQRIPMLIQASTVKCSYIDITCGQRSENKKSFLMVKNHVLIEGLGKTVEWNGKREY